MVICVLIVTAANLGHKLEKLLSQACAGKLAMLCVQTKDAAFSGSGPDLVLVSHPAISRIVCPTAACVVRGTGCLPATIDCKEMVTIVDSSDPLALEEIARRRVRALTCGLSVADTFTLSSLTQESACIFLQRRIHAFDGTPVEPFELPVVFSERIEPFSLMACAAVLCLLGEKNPLMNIGTWDISG